VQAVTAARGGARTSSVNQMGPLGERSRPAASGCSGRLRDGGDVAGRLPLALGQPRADSRLARGSAPARSSSDPPGAASVLDVPGAVTGGLVAHVRGITSVPGLHFLDVP
jgi:hypothetical protein